ncbi:1-phosphofructokinase [uncultured Endozoicomonas sp.]|uniref:1-phosphofructokinase n=1 Tax=uncultured Endozoicomonas sp. TaxID=432652 RepID=UPI00261564C6|nr:1-phosphofructokinase [uncultured Endozoicomonas sp.]
MNQSILTVTLNPALDMTASLPALNVGKVNVIEQAGVHPAGKGINVARVLADLGEPVRVAGFLGAENDNGFRELFQTIGADDQFIRVPGASRTNIKLVDSGSNVTDLNFPGMAVSPSDVDQFEQRLITLAKEHELIVIAGSLPSGVMPEQLNRWITLLNGQGKKVVVDTSRDALKAALGAIPWLVKPNEDELAEWLGEALVTEEALMAAGEQLAATGIAHVVISRGAEGVLWLHEGQWLKSTPPKMAVVSTVGAGDTLVAGLCHGLNQRSDREAVLRQATALSALAVSQVGVGVPDQDQLQKIVQQVSVSTLKSQTL